MLQWQMQWYLYMLCGIKSSVNVWSLHQQDV